MITPISQCWLALGLISSVVTPADDPYRLIQPAFEDGFDFSGAMTVQIESWSDSPAVLQILTVKGKGAKISWIHPSTVQGQVYVDDGKVVDQYVPDKKVIRRRPSFHLFWPSSSELTSLTKKNYTVTVTGKSFRLGRPVVILAAKAKNSELGVRTLAMDRAVPVVLEDTHQVGNSSIVRLKTFHFEEVHPGKISLSLDAPRDVKVIAGWGPEKVTDVKYAAGVVGFTPIVPRVLPFGFQIFAKQLVGSEGDPFFVARVTDGLLTAHVYQWDYKGGEAKTKADIPAMSVDKKKDVAFSILGDVPPEASKRILAAFGSSTE